LTWALASSKPLAGLKLAAVQSVPVQGRQGLCDATIKHGAIRNSLSGTPLQSTGFRGRRVILGLPTELAEPRCVELPLADEPELAVMVEQELGTTGNLQSDFWTAETTRSADGEICRINAIEASPDVLNRCVEDLACLGMDCEIIDALPFALSRAVQFIDPTVSNGPVAALDWGAGHPSFVVVNEDGPILTRSLRGCGLGTAIDQIQTQLSIDEMECAQLLTTCGIQAAGKVTSRIAEQIGRNIADSLDQLIDQLQRTLAFADQRGVKPKHIWLFGCGGTIAGMDQALSAQLDIEVRNWQLAPEQLARPLASLPAHAIFGAAVGFSLLNRNA
jgi:Tfp pilus assembly PilM family ATPase